MADLLDVLTNSAGQTAAQFGVGPVWIDGVEYWSNGVYFIKSIGGKIDTGVGVYDSDINQDLHQASSGSGVVDFILVADSNGLAYGGGWLYGILEGLGWNLGYNLYGSPILSVVENNGSGLSVGTDRQYVAISSGSIGEQSGAPAFCEDQFTRLSNQAAYSYVAAGSEASLFGNFRPGSYKSTTGDEWVARLHHATFASGGGELTTDVRLGVTPYTQLAQDETVNCDTGKDGFQVHDQKFNSDFTVETNSQEYRLKAATLKLFMSYLSFFKSNVTNGFSCSLLSGLGGWQLGGKVADGGISGSFYQNRLLTVAREEVGRYFRIVRERQIALCKRPKICIVINMGMNDRAYNSKAEYKEKLALTYEFLKSAYMIAGGSESELSIILMPSHRVSDNESTDNQDSLTGYSQAADELAIELPRTASINLNSLFTEAEAITNNWYASVSDRAHLSNAGNAALWARGLSQVFNL